MRTVIAGGRNFTDYDLLTRECDKLDISVVISGKATGADQLGILYAHKNQYPVILCPAPWNHFGKRAGYIRNQIMADIAEQVIIFWNGKSPGTKMMKEISEKKGLPLTLIMNDH
jgi:hypothetical protein